MTEAINDKDQNKATQEKFVLEEAQRQEARERGDRPWNPRLFTFNTDTSEWHYRYAEYVYNTNDLTVVKVIVYPKTHSLVISNLLF